MKQEFEYIIRNSLKVKQPDEMLIADPNFYNSDRWECSKNSFCYRKTSLTVLNDIEVIQTKEIDIDNNPILVNNVKIILSDNINFQTSELTEKVRNLGLIKIKDKLITESKMFEIIVDDKCENFKLSNSDSYGFYVKYHGNGGIFVVLSVLEKDIPYLDFYTKICNLFEFR